MNFITFGTEPMVERPGPAGEPPGMPATTTRNYTRENIPTGGTMQSRNHVMQQIAAGGQPSQQQQNSLQMAGV